MSVRLPWLEGARLAPSAHNTQPWRFVPLPDGRTLVRWDPERSLPVSDPTARDLYLALGAAVESARLRSIQQDMPLRFSPAAENLDRSVGWLVPADLPPDPADQRLAPYLHVRQTARTPHLPRPVPSDLLAALAEEARHGGCQLYVLQDRAGIRRLAGLARQATAAQFADAAVHAELWRWLRLDSRHPSYRRDGLTAECLELRGPSLVAARLVLPPTRMRWLVRVGAHQLLAVDTQRLVERSASVCLLSAPSAARADLVRAGQVLLRLWLLAAAAGLRTHPVSALLDCVGTVGPAAAAFGAGGGAPAALFRLGATGPVARAPRLQPEELLEAECGPAHP